MFLSYGTWLFSDVDDLNNANNAVKITQTKYTEHDFFVKIYPRVYTTKSWRMFSLSSLFVHSRLVTEWKKEC